MHVRERLAYLVERVAGEVQKRVDTTQAHDLAGDLVRVVAGLVLDPQVAAERQKLLVQHVGMWCERHRQVSRVRRL